MIPDFTLTVDSDARIISAVGDTRGHLGLLEDQLLVQSALSFFEPRSRKPFSALLKHGPQAPLVTLSNIRVVNLRGGIATFHIAVAQQPQGGILLKFFDERRDLDPEDFEGGVVPLDDLLDRLSDAVGDIGRADARLVLLQINQLAHPEAVEKVEETLTRASLTGAIGSDGKGGYGLLAGAETSDADLKGAVEEAATAGGVSPDRLGLRVDSMAVGDPTAPRGAFQAMFGRVLRRFRAAEPMAETPGETLGVAAKAVGTVQDAVLKALKAGKIALPGRAMTDLTTGAPAARILDPSLDISGRTLIPADRPEVTDSAEMSAAVDLATIEATVKRFGGDLQDDRSQPIFLPLLPATLRAPDLAREIQKRLAAARTPAAKIGLRLTGLDLGAPKARAYRTMQSLTRKGHPVSFPDFIAALDGIRRLSVTGAALVEAPSSLLLDLSRSADGQDTLRRLGTAWSKSHVSILALPAAAADRPVLAEIGVPYARFD